VASDHDVSTGATGTHQSGAEPDGVGGKIRLSLKTEP
jgi:hypothetical protein